MSQSFQLGGDPAQIRASAGQWLAFSQAAGSASSGIRSLDTADFEGDEAETYQDQINSDLPKHLDTASSAWGVVAAALTAYASELEEHQRTMTTLAVRARNQQSAVNSCQTALDHSQRSDRSHALSLIRTRQDLKPGQQMPDDTYVSSTSGNQQNLDGARSALQATYDAASKVRGANDESVRRCRSEIDRAKGMRFAKPPGFWGRLKDSVCGWIADHAGVLLKISSVLKTISGIAGMLALLPIPGFQEVMGGIALASGGAALLIDVGVKLATGKGSWTQIGLDALSMVPGARAAKLSYAVTTGYTAYNVATGKASVSDLVMTVGMGALSMRGGGKFGEEGAVKGPGGPNELPPTKLPDGDGEVVFHLPKKGATQTEIDQMQQYVDVSNEALSAGYLSPTGRVATTGQLRDDANAAIAAERARQEAAGTPFQGVYGHGPDTTWTGKPEAYRWLDQTSRVNSSLGRQAQNYPIGYKPTGFRLHVPSGYQPLSE